MFKRILVPVDFSPCSRAALRKALALAAQTGAVIDLLHVVDLPPSLSNVVVQKEPEGPLTMAAFMLRRAETELSTQLSEVGAPVDVAVNVELIVGTPFDEIIERLYDGYDLAIMGTHGRRGLSHLLMGSVSERVIRHAPCPVLVVRDEYPKRED